MPGDFRKDVSPNTDAKIEELTSAINFVRAQTTSNTAELINLKTEIVTLRKDKNDTCQFFKYERGNFKA